MLLLDIVRNKARKETGRPSSHTGSSIAPVSVAVTLGLSREGSGLAETEASVWEMDVTSASQWLFKENHTYGTSHKILRVFPRARLGKTPSSRWAMPFRDFASEHRALFVAAVRPASWWKARPETISLSFSLARTHRQGVVDIPGTLPLLVFPKGLFPLACLPK